MAELFSLMPKSTSCKSDRMEATRSSAGRSLPAFLQGNAFAARRSHQSNQSNHQDTKAQRTDAFPRAARGNAYSLCLSVFVFLGVFVFSLFFPQTVQKSMTEKAAETDPLSRNRQHFQGVYFLSH
jgi:hypothetical protein